VINRPAAYPNWYPHKTEEIKKYFVKVPWGRNRPQKSPPLVFCIAPHAGWIYSGQVAGSVYSELKSVDTAVFVATNHTGLGAPSSLFSQGTWTTPLGSVSIDERCAQKLLQICPVLQPDLEAHRYEHAIEVQIPFLQVLNPQLQIVPIEMRDYTLTTCRKIAGSILTAIEHSLQKDPARKFAVIASTDFTHCGALYGQIPPRGMTPGAFAKSQDQMAIDRILSLDGAGLLKTVQKNGITMCGSGPATVVLECARQQGGMIARLLNYRTSADVAGETSQIAVGYAGIFMGPGKEL